MKLSDYETTKEVAERLGVSEGRIRQHVMEGRFKGIIKVAGRTFFPKGSRPEPRTQKES